jgi:GTP cyclohydrolase I
MAVQLKRLSEAVPADSVRDGIRALIGMRADPDDPNLLDTPDRVLRAFLEMTSGYSEDPAEILARKFDVERADELIVVRHVQFTSLCEHHLLPFSGEAYVGYLPGDRVAGLSKLARLVDCFARRLQVQERMTKQIADALMEHLEARGAGVVIRAQHSCMGCRGVRKSTADMVTSAILGRLREDVSARTEFLSLCVM